MEDSDELRWALKVVIKRQMRDLLQQLHDVGEEMAILSVNVSEGTASHFGTSQGEWFLSEQKNIKGSFLKYCQSMSKKSLGKPNLQPWIEDINATLESSITTNEEHISTEPSGSSKKSQADQRMSAAKGKKPQPVYLSGKKSSKEPGKAVIKIKVPKGMITSGTSDKDLSGLVGRLLDQELKAQKSKTDASDTDTQNKFSSLLEAANIAKEQVKKTLGKRAGSDDTQSVAKRTRRSGPAPGESPEKGGGDSTRSLRSGRAVSSRFLEGIASLKPKTLGKDKKDESDAEEHSDMDPSESMNLEGAELETVSAQLSKELEQMTLPVLERLETATSEGEVFDNREIKVIVSCEDDEDTADDNIAVDLDIIGGSRKVKQEYISDEEENYDFDDDEFGEDDDMNGKIRLDPDFRPTPKAVNVIQGKPYDDSDETPRRRSGAGKKVELMPRPKKNRIADKMQVQCPHCGTSIVGKSNLQSHIKRVHLKQKKFPCNICSKPFWSNNARESHMLSVHTRQCEDCSEYVVESVPWAEGVDMRSKRDVICTCGSIVSIFSQFGRTKMYHDNFDDESLSRRKKAGESGTKYACGTCGKLFQKRSQCERHSLTHAGVKVFVCDHCGNQYSYQSSLSKHLVSEHGITRFICDYCGKNFTKEAMLKAHMVKVHQYSLSGSIAFTEMTNDEDSQTISEEGMTVDAAQLVAGETRPQPQSQTQTESIMVPMTREGKVDMESQATTVQELTDGSVQEMGDHTVLKIGDGHIAVVLHQPE